MNQAAAVGRAWLAFDRLGPAVTDRLRPFGTMATFEAGSLVLAEGRDTPFFGFVDSGRVALRLRVPELGDRVTIVTIEPGEILGWSAVVPPYRATVDAVATERARILAFDAATLRERLASDDALAAALLPEVLECVSRRLTTSWHQLLDLFATRGQEAW